MSLRILLADDDPAALDRLGVVFRENGHQVYEARNGVEAMELARKGRLDVILLDIRMPSLNGYQACRRIKAEPQLSGIPVILLAPEDTEAERFWGEEVGADLFIPKPVGSRQIVSTIEELVA